MSFNKKCLTIIKLIKKKKKYKLRKFSTLTTITTTIIMETQHQFNYI